ncbi:uncharacterized protein LOC131072140 isoform X2 [Cryptomeria japonica]|uniref:uncharacterized protein LOC131072140 isoform X2 n=1 Tax=Cryptomeria japonica TaxID=3369 RepID=UPI0025AD2DEB|nr:uncharacterized protein LOC131072140 isoform X2 [Cryptomeria japonica]
MVRSQFVVSDLSYQREVHGVHFQICKTSGLHFYVVSDVSLLTLLQFSLNEEISSLSVEPCAEEWIIVTVFEIHKSEVPAFIDREHEFRFLVALPEDISGKRFSHPAVVCCRYSDEEYLQVRCKGRKELFFQRYGRYNINQIWRDDILPCRVYLRHCVLAAKNLGKMAHENFLDHTFLGDRKTSIRQYLASQGLGIMEEEPPEMLKERYGG